MRKNVYPAMSVIGAVMGLVMLAACGSVAPVPEDQFYRLKVQTPSKAGKVLFRGTLEIDRFVADGLTAGLSLIHI